MCWDTVPALIYNNPLNGHYIKALWSLLNLDKIHIVSMQYEKQIDDLTCLRPDSIPLSFY